MIFEKVTVQLLFDQVIFSEIRKLFINAACKCILHFLAAY